MIAFRFVSAFCLASVPVALWPPETAAQGTSPSGALREARADSSQGTRLPTDLATTVREYYEAQLRNDVATLDRLVADDYVLINSDGSVENKREAVADHERPGFKIDPYVVEQPVEKVWSDAALTGGVVNLSWTQDGKHQTRLIRIVNVWARRDGRWRITYTQVSRLPPPGSAG